MLNNTKLSTDMRDAFIFYYSRNGTHNAFWPQQIFSIDSGLSGLYGHVEVTHSISSGVGTLKLLPVGFKSLGMFNS